MIEKKHPQRSDPQRKSLQVGCKLLADKLNDAGLDQKKVIAKMPEIIDIPWTATSIKELYRVLMFAMFSYTSTTQLNTQQVSDVWDKLMLILTSEWGPDVDVPFPDESQTRAYLESFKK